MQMITHDVKRLIMHTCTHAHMHICVVFQKGPVKTKKVTIKYNWKTKNR